MSKTEYRGYAVETIIERIAGGDSVAKLAAELKTSRQALHQWLTNNYNDDYQQAQTISADGLMDKAEEAILDENLDIARGRELANHYRHVAKSRNPKKYGDRQQLELSGHLDTLSDEQLNQRIARLLGDKNE